MLIVWSLSTLSIVQVTITIVCMEFLEEKKKEKKKKKKKTVCLADVDEFAVKLSGIIYRSHKLQSV